MFRPRTIRISALAALLVALGVNATGRDGCTWTEQPDGSRSGVCIYNGAAYCLICPTPGICNRIPCPG
jgi:hypothetical protein